MTSRLGIVVAACTGLVVVVVIAAATVSGSPAPSAGLAPVSASPQETIPPLPEAPLLDARRVALGERLFHDTRLSKDGTRSCSSCHDLSTNGAAAGPVPGAEFDTPTVFNAALGFRLGWRGRFRTLEAQAEALIESPKVMGGTLASAVGRLAADPGIVDAFRAAYGGGPTRERLLDAVATFERSLLTPRSRFDAWLGGDAGALSDEEKEGLRLFGSLGCTSCHQGVNIGGNLFQRRGIFKPLAPPEPDMLRVPSLRNIAATAPYFHDGSAPDLDTAVRRMAEAQLNVSLEPREAAAIVAFLGTLTGRYRGQPVRPAVPK